MGLGGSIRGSSLGGALGGAGLLEFDSGLFVPQRTAVRQHVVARLQPLLKANGLAQPGYLHAIGRVPAPLRGREDEDFGYIVQAIGGRVPAVVVAIGDKEYEYTGMSAEEAIGKLDVHLYVLSGHLRAFVDGRLELDNIAKADPTADPGIEVILEHLEQLMSGQELDLSGTLEFRAQAETALATAADCTIWEQRYTVLVDRDVKPWRGIAQVVTEVQVKHDLDGADAANPIVTTLTELEVP